MLTPYPKFKDKTPVIVRITEGVTENGEPIVVVTYDGKCHFDEKAKTMRGRDGLFINLEGKVTIGTDIAPGIKQLSGTVELVGKTYKIYKGSRLRSNNGSVHHTELELV